MIQPVCLLKEKESLSFEPHLNAGDRLSGQGWKYPTEIYHGFVESELPASYTPSGTV
jgi:hypothetical protein